MGPIFLLGLLLTGFLSSLRLEEHVGLLAFLATGAFCLVLPLFLDWLEMQRELFEKKPTGSGPRMTLLQTVLILFGVSIELGAGMDVLKSDLPILSSILFLVTPVIVLFALETLEVRGPFSKFRNGLRHRFGADEPPAPQSSAPDNFVPENSALPELPAEPEMHALRNRLRVKRGRLAGRAAHE
ncbi:MAG: hypothetical protein HY291_19680 [Planctomycetes bacterium]|nr:hypothetical protein [Planctomycetota bacterium]